MTTTHATSASTSTSPLESLQHLNAEQLRRLLVEQLTRQKLGLYWESDAIARDAALNAKDDTKDAARKARHFPASYGKVLFLTPDGNQRMRWVNDDGSLGEVLDFEDLQSALGHLVATRPEGV